MKKWVVFLLAAVLVVSSLPGAMAAGKKTKATVYGLDADFFSWVYATDTIPEGVEMTEASSSLYLRSSKGGEATEYLFDCTVTFVSGDPALKDAFVVRKAKNKMIIAVDNNVVRQPGEAVFRITCEGGTLKADEERTLRVIPYAGNETPGTVLSAGKNTFTVRTGDGALSLLLVQLEGKKLMDAGAFLRGTDVQPGEVLKSL